MHVQVDAAVCGRNVLSDDKIIFPNQVLLQVDTPSVPQQAVLSEDPDPSFSDLAAFTCEKIETNADTDENSELIVLGLIKV